MKATMLLCDYAQVADNKMYIVGAGWDVCGTPTPPHGVAVLLSVPWHETNIRHTYRLRLLSEDGAPVQQTGPNGPVPIAVEGTVEVGRPAGMPPGSPISVPLALNVLPINLPPGAGFSWRLTVDDSTDEDWMLPFRTRAR